MHKRLTTGKTAKEWKAFNFMKLIEQGTKCNYLINESGEIFRQYKRFTKPVEKRIGSRGFCEFKMNNKTVLYHQIVAKILIPNPKKCNKVFFKSTDKFDLRPENLKWVWTREGRRFTIQQAIEKSNDRDLKAYYRTKDKRVLDSYFLDIVDKMYLKHGKKAINEHLADLTILIYNYAERNLLFNLKNDMEQTFYGLVKQDKRRRISTVQLNERYL